MSKKVQQEELYVAVYRVRSSYSVNLCCTSHLAWFRWFHKLPACSDLDFFEFIGHLPSLLVSLLLLSRLYHTCDSLDSSMECMQWPAGTTLLSMRNHFEWAAFAWFFKVFRQHAQVFSIADWFGVQTSHARFCASKAWAQWSRENLRKVLERSLNTPWHRSNSLSNLGNKMQTAPFGGLILSEQVIWGDPSFWVSRCKRFEHLCRSVGRVHSDAFAEKWQVREVKDVRLIYRFDLCTTVQPTILQNHVARVLNWTKCIDAVWLET